MTTEKEFTSFEPLFHKELLGYLTEHQMVDQHLPEAPDIEQLWAKIGESYLPDGIREFTNYPTVSLGWMMFIGMAIAKYWDEDWTIYGRIDNLYSYLLQQTDFDHLDDYICRKVLMLSEKEHQALSKHVAECASRTYSLICHMHIQPGTAEAFQAYIAALHQFYLMGAYIQLKSLGYHMSRLA